MTTLPVNETGPFMPPILTPTCYDGGACRNADEIERIANNLSSLEIHLLEISDNLLSRLQRAEGVISQFVHERAPMTPEQRAAWTAWKDGEA